MPLEALPAAQYASLEMAEVCVQEFAKKLGLCHGVYALP